MPNYTGEKGSGCLNNATTNLPYSNTDFNCLIDIKIPIM